MKYSENAFLAWVAARLHRFTNNYNYACKLVSTPSVFRHSQLTMSHVETILEHPVISDFRRLLAETSRGNSVLEKEQYECLVELSNPENKVYYIQQMTQLAIHSAIIDTLYKYRQINEFRTLVTNVDAYLARELLGEGCPENRIVSRKIPKSLKLEPTASLYHAMTPIVNYMSREAKNLNGIQRHRNRRISRAH